MPLAKKNDYVALKFFPCNVVLIYLHERSHRIPRFCITLRMSIIKSKTHASIIEQITVRNAPLNSVFKVLINCTSTYYFNIDRISFEDEEYWNECIIQTNQLSILNIPIDIDLNNQLFALTTCSHHHNNGIGTSAYREWLPKSSEWKFGGGEQ